MDNQEHEVSYEFNTSLSTLESLYWDTYFYDTQPETVKKWLKNPMLYNKELRILSNRLYNANGVYTNVIDYMVSLPTLDRVIYSLNKGHSRFKKNKDLFLQALKKIKDKVLIRDIIHKLGVDGISFHYFEKTSTTNFQDFMSDTDIDQIQEINANDFNCSVISLPTDYCKIVGRKNSSYVMAFNLSYFDQFTGNGRSLKLKRYPKEIREKYRKYKKDQNKRWAVLDNNKTLVNKVRSKIEEPWGRPIGLAAFIDMLYDEYFTDTKRNTLDDANSQIVYQTFPEGETKGKSSLTQTQQRDQHNNIKSALFSKSQRKGINFFSVAAGTELDKIPINIDILKTNMENDLMKKIATDLGFAGSALNGSDGNYSSQQTNMELVSAEIFSWFEQIQEELVKVINSNIINDKQCFIDVYYLPISNANRDKMVRYMKELYTQGRGSLMAWIASTGFNPEAYLSLMDAELEDDFENKYPVHATSHTMSGKDEGGRPSNNSPTNSNTIKSKTNNIDIRPD